ncbi:MAG TPA: DNA alkylation repair protein [Candidatus Limnocylindrales bacterium]
MTAESFKARLRPGMGAGEIFALAKEFIDLPPGEISRLLDSPAHDARVGALSIMDKQARRKSTPDTRRKELYDLYLGRMDAIGTWDLVDLGAPWVIGRYLADRPRDVLYSLAASENPWERRTAIVSCLFFVRQGEVGDTFAIAAILARDPHDYVRKATGGLLREAGKKDQPRLLSFLDEHAASMPREMLRYATERLDKPVRQAYLSLQPKYARNRPA